MSANDQPSKLDPTATTAEQLAVMEACPMRRNAADARMVAIAIRCFAGMPRLTGIPGLTLEFARNRTDLLEVKVRTRAGSGSIHRMHADATPPQMRTALDEIATALAESLTGADGTMFPRERDADRPWTFRGSAVLIAMLTHAGIAPRDYMAHALGFGLRNEMEHGYRHGDVPTGMNRNATERDGLLPDAAFPWDLPYHSVRRTGRDFHLQTARLSDAAFWKRKAAGLHPGIALARTMLPQALQNAAVGRPLSEVVGHPLTLLSRLPVMDCVVRGRTTTLTSPDELLPMAPPPREIDEAVRRMLRGIEVMKERVGDDARTADADGHREGAFQWA